MARVWISARLSTVLWTQTAGRVGAGTGRPVGVASAGHAGSRNCRNCGGLKSAAVPSPNLDWFSTPSSQVEMQDPRRSFSVLVTRLGQL